MRDSQVRIKVGIGLTRAAKQIGIAVNTLRVYEIDPKAIRDESKRERCARYYLLLREFLNELAA